MADISKCPGTDCPMRDSCYRYIAPSNNFWQSYFTTAPIEVSENKCEYYWPIEKEDNEKSN